MNKRRIYQHIEIIKFADKLTGTGSPDGVDKKALDVSCGGGLALKSSGYDVYGFDINPSYIDGLKRAGFSQVTVGDVEQGTPFNDYFDLNNVRETCRRGGLAR